ncbi:PepSY domain-containing protein [Pararhodobacter sp.]|uniref:PepSY domain-containing protein n=1 Tax=Pararhodobacter sp. TaxID=2127056 RepID=UPI002AFEB9C9|nr:PepSY domain-containing protein [Pararhodobacter sp.]
MTHILKTLAIVAALALPGAALASSDDRPVAEDVRASIVTTLEAQGYQVFTIESERGGYEVKAALDGRLWELRLNAAYEITRTELED